MRRCLQRVAFNVVVSVAKNVRRVEDEASEDHQEDDDREAVFHCVVRVERNCVFLLVFDVYTSRVVVARCVERPDVKDHNTCDHEWQQVVEREEAVQRSITDRWCTLQPDFDLLTDQWNSTDQVCDNGRAVQRHLTPWENVAHEGCTHHEKVDDNTEDPADLTRSFVRSVIEAAEHVDVHREEEHGSAVRVDVTDQPAIFDVTHNALNARKRHVDVWNVVHCENDTGDDLCDEADREDRAKRPPVVQVFRYRKTYKRIMDQTHDRKTRIDPFLNAGTRLVCGFMSAHRSSPFVRLE